MKGIKLPATIRWAITNCLLIWLTMSLYRSLLLGIFFNGNPEEIFALLNGLLIDAGLLSSILVMYILVSLIPVLHPFKTKSGKLFGFLYFMFWGLVIAFAYAIDLMFIKATHYRAYGAKMFNTFNDKIETEIFFKNFSWFPFLLGITLLLWIWGIIIVKLHGYIGRLPRLHSKSKKSTWKLAVIITGILLIVLAFLQYEGLKSSDLNLEMKPEEALKVNPVLSLLLL